MDLDLFEQVQALVAAAGNNADEVFGFESWLISLLDRYSTVLNDSNLSEDQKEVSLNAIYAEVKTFPEFSWDVAKLLKEYEIISPEEYNNYLIMRNLSATVDAPEASAQIHIAA